MLSAELTISLCTLWQIYKPGWWAAHSLSDWYVQILLSYDTCCHHVMCLLFLMIAVKLYRKLSIIVIYSNFICQSCCLFIFPYLVNGFSSLVHKAPVHSTYIHWQNEPYLPLPYQPKSVLIYRPRRDRRLSWQSHMGFGWALDWYRQFVIVDPEWHLTA